MVVQHACRARDQRGGVGYLVAVSRGDRPARGRRGRSVATHLIVREDALQLYGFASADERELFELLLGVSGWGRRSRSRSSRVAAGRAAARDRAQRRCKRFQAIPGIGLKTAQRVVMELKDKLTLVDVGRTAGDEGLTARDALVELGWTLIDAERALAECRRVAAGRGTGAVGDVKQAA